MVVQGLGFFVIDFCSNSVEFRVMPSHDDIILAKHGEVPQSPPLPRDIRLVSVVGKVIVVRWGLRGWSQMNDQEQTSIKKRHGIE